MTDLGKKTILLVEDQAIIAMKEAKTIEKFGYNVETVHKGEDAVSKALKDEEIDLILMDIDLGSGIDGTEASRQILAQRTLPIVFLTSHAEEEYVEKAREITKYGYVLKNSGNFVLRASIEMAFELFESHQQTYKAKEEFRTTLYSIGDGVITTDRKGLVQHINQIAENLTGYSEDEIRGTHLDEIFSIINEETREKVESPVSKVMRDGKIIGMANHTLLISREGKEIPISDSGAPIKNQQGEISGVVLVFQDQSQERQIQKDIEYRDQQFRRAELNASLGHWELDLETKTIRVSKGARYLYGLPDQENFDYEFIKQIPLYEYREALDEEMRQLIEEGKPYDINFKIETYDSGEIRDIHSTAEYDTDENHVFGIIRDITERMNVERALHKKNHQLQERIKEFDYLTYISRLETDTNISLDTFLQRSVELLPGSLQYPHYASARITVNGDKYETKDFKETEWRLSSDIKGENRSIGSVEVFYTKETPEEDEGPFLAEERSLIDSVASVLGYYIERRKTREELELSQYVIDYSAIGIYRLDEDDASILYVNDHACKMLGYSKEEMLNMTLHDVDPDFHLEEWYQVRDQIYNQGYGEVERKHQRKDGTLMDVLITQTYLKGKYGRLSFSFVKDITEQKQKERRIEQLLNEKELLLQEVHHRIKNNMSTISSLLLLRSNMAKDEETATQLREAENEVRGMALLYDKLYRSGSEHYKEVEADAYFNDLVDEIMAALSEDKDISVTKDIDNFVLDTTTAFPVAIIINELLSNAVKHAFKGKEKGKLWVKVDKNENGLVQVSVEDNGVGLPGDLTPETSEGFGFQLINAFTNQLNGNLEINRNNGTTFILEFQEESK